MAVVSARQTAAGTPAARRPAVPVRSQPVRTQILPVQGGGWFAGEAQRWRMLAGVFGLLLVLGGAWYMVRLAFDPVRSAVTQVDVLGTLDYTDRNRLRERVLPHLAAGFFRLDIAAIRQDVMAMPWVSDVQVRRVWPAGLAIEVQEHTPVARWNDDALLGADETPFRAPQLQAGAARQARWQAHWSELPRLAGAEGRHVELLDSFRRYARRLSAIGLRLHTLREDDRLSQTLELANGTTVRLGYEQRAQRFARFIDVYPRVMRELARSGSTGAAQGGAAGDRPEASAGNDEVARFDMRYSNGFALSGVATSLDS